MSSGSWGGLDADADDVASGDAALHSRKSAILESLRTNQKVWR